MLRPSDVHLPFQLCHIQLPVRLAYSMNINKAQQQTFQKVGLELPNPVFGHGQLYAAFSRAITGEDVRVKLYQTEDRVSIMVGLSLKMLLILRLSHLSNSLSSCTSQT